MRLTPPAIGDRAGTDPGGLCELPLDEASAAWPVNVVPVGGIANILHRATLALIVGDRTFERGERCFQSGRVMGVESGPGELCGVVRPQEAGRRPYEVRIWVRDDGLAYQCTCPIGESRQFCKHAVAIALAHLERDHQRAERDLAALRTDLMHVSMAALLDGLVEHARVDSDLLDALKRICERAKR